MRKSLGLHETYLVASHFMLLADRPGVSDLAYRQAFSHCHFPKLFATISASTALRYTSLDIARPPYLFFKPLLCALSAVALMQDNIAFGPTSNQTPSLGGAVEDG